MRKEQITSSVASGNLPNNYIVNQTSFLDQFKNWFRNFIENAE
ncbi:MAG: hypothetical protein AB8B78_04675 [Polaribacter sp.]